MAEVVAPCGVEELFGWVDDLARYPAWLEIVQAAVSIPTDSIPGGALPAWAVDLRGRLGPLARSKRLRMVRAICDAPTRVVFERAEIDGRDHSPWILEAKVSPHPDGAMLTMRLHYGGGLFGPVVERVLREEIEGSRQRLVDLIVHSSGAR